MNSVFEALKPYLDRMMALKAALVLFEWDDATLAPEKAGELTEKVIGTLSGEYFGAVNNETVKELAEKCAGEEGLSEAEAGQVRELLEEISKLDAIPQKEYQEFSQLTAGAVRIWTKAKADNDFDAFAPTLEKVIDFQKRFAAYRAKEGQKKYDVMLNDFEPGFSMELLDEFFGVIKKEIVPLLKAVQESKVEIPKISDKLFLILDSSPN